jgi:xylulokinase
MDQYVIAHDVGTSSVKTALVNQKGEVLANSTTPYPTYYPKPGWVEQNPEDYWNGIVLNTRKVVESSKIDRQSIIGIVFSTQAMGIIPLDEHDHLLRSNITWVDGRAEEQASRLMGLMGGKKIFTRIIGIEITGKDVIPKLKWLKDNEPKVYSRAVSILDVNGYLKFRATGKKVFEWSGACSYGFDLKHKDWERMVFKAAGIDLSKLPPLIRSTDLVGTLTLEAASELDLPTSVPVYGGCDDTQSAAIGSGSTHDGDTHIYLGTSAWVGISTSKNLNHKNGAAVLQSADPTKNLIVGITESAGANLEWMIEKFYKYEKNDPACADIYSFINSETIGIPPGSDHLIFTPWMLGERCPVSTTTTRGTLFNLGHEHTRGHFVNAMLEGIAFNLRWIMENFKRDFGYQSSKIRAIGGGTINEQWMQGIANITGKTVETITQHRMAGSLGAAMCVFVGNGIYSSFDEVNNLIRIKKVYLPDKNISTTYDELFRQYKGIYYSLKNAYIQANANRFKEV